jgi:hypothetical protein
MHAGRYACRHLFPRQRGRVEQRMRIHLPNQANARCHTPEQRTASECSSLASSGPSTLLPFCMQVQVVPGCRQRGYNSCTSPISKKHWNSMYCINACRCDDSDGREAIDTGSAPHRRCVLFVDGTLGGSCVILLSHQSLGPASTCTRQADGPGQFRLTWSVAASFRTRIDFSETI